MNSKIIKKDGRMSWHTDKRLMIGLLITVIPTLFISIWNASFLLRTLDTNPSLVDRVSKLEFQFSEQGRVNVKILEVLEELQKDSKSFREEQARRTPMVNYIEKKMGGN